MQKTPPLFSTKDRTTRISKSINQEYDLAIIGGGVTGAGIALDASLRGMRALLVEKGDFGSGTSSKSTKLIHGGLRYLKQLELGLVRESGLERAIAHENICHLVHPESMILPIAEGGTFGKFTAGLAISVYDRLAKVEEDLRRRSLKKEEMIELEPLFKEELIKSGILYSEYRTDDARLTLEIIKAAHRNGSTCFNHLEVTGFQYSNNKINGIHCHDHITKESLKFRTKKVISAAGPWVDKISLLDKESSDSNLHLTKGIHIIFNKDKFPLNNSVYFDAFDGRLLFAIPRADVVYVGTTDTTYDTDLDDVRCSEEDVNYIIKAVKNFFNLPELTAKDITSTWAGLRPLIKQKGKGPTEISRKDEVFFSDSGLVTIAGGKLTGYRKMAERVIDTINEKSKNKFKGCCTEDYKIHHNSFSDYASYLNCITKYEKQFPEQRREVSRLVTTYGKDAFIILSAAGTMDDLIRAELDYCLEHESIYHPLDFLNRRTGWLYFDIASVKKHAATVIEYLANYLSRDEKWIEKITQEVQEQIDIHSLQFLHAASV